MTTRELVCRTTGTRSQPLRGRDQRLAVCWLAHCADRRASRAQPRLRPRQTASASRSAGRSCAVRCIGSRCMARLRRRVTFPRPLRSRRSSRRSNPASCTGKGASTISVAVARRTWPIETATMSPMTASSSSSGRPNGQVWRGHSMAVPFTPLRWRREIRLLRSDDELSRMTRREPRNLKRNCKDYCVSSAAFSVCIVRGRRDTRLLRDGRIRFRPQSTPSIAGRLPAHGRACSNSAAMRNRRASSPRRPTSWIAIGRPSLWKPQGSVIAGWPVRLKGCV